MVLLWHRNDRSAIIVMLGCAVLARIALVPTAPFLSHDTYRYLWDARLLMHGYDPLALAPNDSALATFRADPIFQWIEWRDIPSLYPPLAYLVFTIGALIPVPGALGEKLVLAAGDLVAMGGIVALLRRMGLPGGRAAIYAWSPLVLVEFSGSGHVESWAVAAVVFAIFAVAAGQTRAGVAAMAAAILTKLTPAVLLPIVFARNVRAALWTCAVVAVTYVPLALHARPVFGSLRAYVYDQRFNDTLFYVIGAPGAAVVMVAAVLVAVRARALGASLVGCIIAVELAFFAVAPNVLPWYLTIFAALVPLIPRGAPRGTAVGLVAWTVTAPLTYGVPWLYPAGSIPDYCVRIVEYAPVVAGLLYDLRWYFARPLRVAAVSA